MKLSKLFGKTIRETPSDISMISHKLLYQGGFIRESTAGRYYFLPLGWRVHEKIKAIIKLTPAKPNCSAVAANTKSL